MKKHVLRSLIILIGLAFISIGVVLAHGTPVIAVQPTIVPAGGQITVAGTEMEAGETFTLTLEGPANLIYLGTVTAQASNVGGANMSSDSQMPAAPESEPTTTAEGAAAAGETAAEGGFTVAFTIPDNTPPGSYTVKASPEDGDATETDLTITGPSDQASARPATVQEPTGEQHQLDRSKPTGEIVGIVAVAIVSGGLGLWLTRKR